METKLVFLQLNKSLLSYLQLGIQVSIRSHYVLILLLARGFDEDLLGLPELLLHASHHRAVLTKQSPAAAQHVPCKPGAETSVSDVSYCVVVLITTV